MDRGGTQKYLSIEGRVRWGTGVGVEARRASMERGRGVDDLDLLPPRAVCLLYWFGINA